MTSGLNSIFSEYESSILCRDKSLCEISTANWSYSQTWDGHGPTHENKYLHSRWKSSEFSVGYSTLTQTYHIRRQKHLCKLMEMWRRASLSLWSERHAIGLSAVQVSKDDFSCCDFCVSDTLKAAAHFLTQSIILWTTNFHLVVTK